MLGKRADLLKPTRHLFGATRHRIPGLSGKERGWTTTLSEAEPLQEEKKWKHHLMPSDLRCKDKQVTQCAQKQLSTLHCSRQSVHLMRHNRHTPLNLVTRDQAMTGMQLVLMRSRRNVPCGQASWHGMLIL